MHICFEWELFEGGIYFISSGQLISVGTIQGWEEFKEMTIYKLSVLHIWKYWRELNLAVGPKIAIEKILADLNLVVW